MKTHTQVAVIGGGVVGCSVLYHLTKLGWNDLCLIERSELTSGSTWHAAGGFHTLNSDTDIAALQSYTIGLYKELEKISGQSCGLHHVGGISLAANNDRMDFLKAERAKHNYMGVDSHLVTPAESGFEIKVEGERSNVYVVSRRHIKSILNGIDVARAKGIAGDTD